MRKQILVSAVALILGLAAAYEEMTLNDFMNGTIDQKLDHFNAKVNTTFKQRYFMNDTYWDPNVGPIFLYICGESTCKPPTERGYPFQLCQDMNCLFYVLEHRYYGESQPFSNWSVDSLKYLNSTQALADLNYFIKDRNVELQKKWGSAERKWLTIGGSYPGALSAWFKSQYPESAAAAWSSSGVIQAITDYSDYDLDIYQATSRSGPICPEEIQAINTYVEQAITGNLTQADKDYVQSIFGNQGLNNSDFMNYFADTFAGSIQYGKRTSLCSLLISISSTPIKDQLPVIKQYADQQGMSVSDYYLDYLQNTTIDFSKNQRQWTWQICTEFGWFQTPNPEHPMRSQLINITYWLDYCQQVFGKDAVSTPNVDYYNSLYGGYNMTGSKIIFLNAIEDPWQYAGMRKIYDSVSQVNMTAILIDCNNCAHCVDLKSPTDNDAPSLTLARKKIKNQLMNWLDISAQEEVKEAMTE